MAWLAHLEGMKSTKKTEKYYIKELEPGTDQFRTFSGSENGPPRRADFEQKTSGFHVVFAHLASPKRYHFRYIFDPFLVPLMAIMQAL